MTGSYRILISAINARHSHSSMGARCLLANMGELRDQTGLVEFTIQQSAAEIAEAITARNPGILALGVYIWNVKRVHEVLQLLREKLPDLKIVLGGPELPHTTTADFLSCCSRPRWGRGSNRPDADGTASLPNSPTTSGVNAPGYSKASLNADFILLGEGDLAFAALCRDLLAGRPVEQVLMTPLPDLNLIQMPYAEYSDEDLAHRLLYVESSRGCGMRCDYCVSATDPTVRFFPMPGLLAAFDRLLARGARQFKFCDRSFNIHIPRAIEILEFFLERISEFPDLFLHFEMLPDRFPETLRTMLAQFPPRSLQLEIGLQSLNPEVLERIRRPQDLDRAAEAIRFLHTQTTAWIHADLIAGLPGETPESFGAGFDQLVEMGPHEIQLGILKKLPGAPIDRHDTEFEMRYDAAPPYEIRSTRDWSAGHLVRTARFAHYWDAVVNSGRFIAAAPLIWQDTPSVFEAFLSLADWMGERFPKEHGIPLGTLLEALFEFLADMRGIPPKTAAEALIRGYRHTGARDIPAALAPHLSDNLPPPTRGLPRALRRQFLHWTWDQT